MDIAQLRSFCEAQAPDKTATPFAEAFLAALNGGHIRVYDPVSNSVNAWVKQGILHCFRLLPMAVSDNIAGLAFDKIPLKFDKWTDSDFTAADIRVVPGAIVRTGAYIGPKTVLMPSFVNIGAYIGSGCMIDTFATVGSCAQIGDKVHLSGGAGIGGVLEPLQAQPVIIENNAFIGARSEIVEGVRVGEGAVIGMGVYIGQSTRIYDRQSDTVLYGEVPPGAVVVSGTLPDANGQPLYAAIIVKKVDAKTRAKTAINELLRIW